MEHYIIIWNYDHKAFLMFGKIIRNMLQCDLNRTFYFIAHLFWFPPLHTPNFYKYNEWFFFFFNKSTCTSELLVFHNHSYGIAKFLSPDLISADPCLPGPKLNCTGWWSLVCLRGCPFGKVDGPSPCMLCSGPCHPQNLAPKRRQSTLPDFGIARTYLGSYFSLAKYECWLMTLAKFLHLS